MSTATTVADTGSETDAGTDLETGWGPTTPVDDTVQHQFVVASAASYAAAAEAGGGRVRRDERFVAVDHRRPTDLFDSATLLRPLHGEQLHATLAEVEAFYDEQGSGTALLWSPWPTPDLHDRGWVLEGHPPLLVRPAGAVEADHDAFDATTDGFEVTPVEDPGALEEWCRVAVEGFPLEEVEAGRHRSLLDPGILDDDRFRFHVGSVDGRAVAIGSQYVEHGLNLLWLAVTRPEVRGRGHYHAMVAHRIADRPDLPAAAIVSDLSRPILVDRFGFLPVMRFTLWTWPRS